MAESMDDFFGNIEGAKVKGGGNYIRPGQHKLKFREFKSFKSDQDLGNCCAAEFEVLESKGVTEQLASLGTTEQGFGPDKVSPPHDVGEIVSVLFTDLANAGQEGKTVRDNLLTLVVGAKGSLVLGAEAAPPVRKHYADMGVDIDTKAATRGEMAVLAGAGNPLEGVVIDCMGRTIKTKKKGQPFTALRWYGCAQS
jgi:hypothetical protein